MESLEINTRAFEKSNGETKEISLETYSLRKVKLDRSHLCWDCANASANKCKKVADRQKKNIESYDFIEESIQNYKTAHNGDEICDELLVTRCKNFEFDEPKQKLTASESLDKVKKLASLKMLYFSGLHYDCDTLTRANMVEETMIKNGTLTPSADILNWPTTNKRLRNK